MDICVVKLQGDESLFSKALLIVIFKLEAKGAVDIVGQLFPVSSCLHDDFFEYYLFKF